MAFKPSLLKPLHPERICWGCERMCPAHDLACGNGSVRAPHPSEIFGDDWLEWSHAEATPSDEQGAAPAALADEGAHERSKKDER